MIRARELHAQLAGSHVRGASFALDRGVHALLGVREDGPPVILAALAGRTQVRAAELSVLGAPPGDPRTRRAIAYVPFEVALPDALSVGESLTLAARIRGEAPSDPAARLATLGLAPLLRRRALSLTREEARAVALCEAVTSRAVELLLLEEPFVLVDARASSELLRRLRERADKGACVVLATASPRDVAPIADSQLTFERGILLRHGEVMDPVTSHPTGVHLRVLSSSPRALLEALACDPAVDSVEAQGGALLLGATHLVPLAAAVGRAAVRAKVEIHSMVREVAPLEVARAAAAGAAQAAFQISYERARQEMAPPAPPSAPPFPPRGQPAE